jgi:hypothetical protein
MRVLNIGAAGGEHDSEEGLTSDSPVVPPTSLNETDFT